MISILYEPFKKWSERGSVYIISDPHFLDAESFEFRKAQGKLPKEINSIGALADYQIKEINKVVHRDDTLVCLGDVGDIECVKKLRAGHKVLILGNHDRGAAYYKRDKKYILDNEHGTFEIDLNMYRVEDNRLFDEVYAGPLMISDKILLSHEPIIPCPDYIVNLCGHVHANKHKFKIKKHQYYNFCAEAINYKPISLADLIKNGLLSKVKDIHEVTVAGAVERRKHKAGD
jgi:calcineurin-like phosphoesterase family protein